MASFDAATGFDIDSTRLKTAFDREPFGFSHNLAECELFSDKNLKLLVDKYSALPNERCKYHYIAGSAEAPGTRFSTVPMPHLAPNEAFARLAEGSCRMVLKRTNEVDDDHRALMEHLFRGIVERLGGLKGDRLVRLEGGLLISSAAATTPFHFDPEVNFFCQIEGDKIYHVYSPEAVSEAELEEYYRRGRRTIAELPLAGRDPAREHVFTLAAGLGLHQPENAPHWVETRGTRSISYSIVFETESMRARARTRAANYYLRRLSLSPARPGAHPAADTLKSGVMSLTLPVRTALADAVHNVRRRAA